MVPFSLVYHEGYLTSYYTSTVECPERVKAIYSKLRNRFPVIRPEPADLKDIYRVHTSALVQRVQLESRETYETALLAAGGAITAAEQAVRGILAFGLVRPPGHHAGPDHYWGYCFFNNIAVAISRLIARQTIGRVLVLDLDLHHGDGTETIFMENQAVNVVNISARTRATYLAYLEKEMESCKEVDLLAISAGFDTYIRDWGGILNTDDYRAVGKIISDAALRLSHGRCFAVLEGGYYLPDLGKNVLAFCEGLVGT